MGIHSRSAWILFLTLISLIGVILFAILLFCFFKDRRRGL